MKKLYDGDLKQLFDEFLDEQYELIKVAGLEYQVSDVLKNVDPVAYRCGLADWLDAMVEDGFIKEIEGEYYE
jgi:hypothetical protein